MSTPVFSPRTSPCHGQRLSQAVLTRRSMCLVKRRHISHLCLDFRDPNLLAINQNTCSEGSLCQWLTFIPVISGPFVLPLESSVSFKINFFYCLCQAWVCKCGVRIKSPETHIERPKRHGFWHWSQVGFFLFVFFFLQQVGASKRQNQNGMWPCWRDIPLSTFLPNMQKKVFEDGEDHMWCNKTRRISLENGQGRKVVEERDSGGNK